MVRDDHDPKGQPPQAPAAGEDIPAGGVDVRLAVALLALTAVLTAGGVFGARWLFSGGGTMDGGEPKGTTPPGPSAYLFRGWDKPDLVLVLSSQQHGYLQPCGCTRPQRGGLERRYNFLQQLRQRGWPVVPLDLGDVPQTSGPRDLPNVQGVIKYRYAMQAMQLMGYRAVGIGETEGALPLKEALDNYSLNNPDPPVICTNLAERNNNFPGEVQDSVVTTTPGGLKVAVLGLVGPTVTKRMSGDPLVKFLSSSEALQEALKNVKKEQPDLRVLLYQGSAAEARRCAQAFQPPNLPPFDVVLCQSPDDEGPSQPEQVGLTCLVKGAGHKGKNVGVLGIFKTGNPGSPYEFRYHLVALGEEYATPPGEEDRQPVARLMESYTQELRSGGYLQKYGQSHHPMQAESPDNMPLYVGSERCKKCHEHAYEVWKKSGHAHAYQTLVDVKHPSLRQYDGECVVCHVTGFAYKGGFTDEGATPHLKDVGCESCHGPASAHVRDPENPKWHAKMNPWKAPEGEDAAHKATRILAIDKACQRCHDPENDVHWSFEEKWPKIEHHTP